ncbi:MAG: c-type cytochrome, partial [Bradyrhizobium sp.]
MESFELNKVLGAILGSCLILLSVHLFADSLFAPVLPAKPGFVIAVQTKSPSTAPKHTAPAVAPIATRLASAKISVGKSESHICMTCHNLQKGGPNEIGPNLFGVVGRPRASHPGYDYSSAMKAKGGTWTFTELDKFLTHPQGYIPGTKMTFAGFKNPEQRADIIAYLRTLSDHPLPLPKAPPPAKVAAQQKPPSAAPKPAAAAVAPIATRLASANVNVGKSESHICMACHNLQKGGPNEVGPNLFGVVDRPRASHPGYDYSAAMKAKGGKWTFTELDKFLNHPNFYIPGTK